MDWYVIFVESGKEEVVQKWLSFHFEKKILHSMIPKRRLKEKRNGNVYNIARPLFPGYVFIRTTMDLDKYRTIKSIPHLIKILSTDSYYSKISNEEMYVIHKLMNDDGTIECSKVFIENSNVYVKAGPLCCMEGIIKKINKHTNRAKILLDFMGEPRLIDVGIEVLYKLE